MGGNTTSHVANATGETIYGKCQDNPSKVDFDVGIEVDTPKGGGGFNVGVEDKTPHIPAGFVALASRDFIGFPSTHPYLSIKTKSGKVICENYHPGQDMSVIVTPDLTLQRAKYGTIWVGNDGERSKKWKFCPDSHKAPEKRRVEITEQTIWRKPKQDLSDEVLHSKIPGVGKAKRKTRRGKRGGVRRKMQKLQREHKMLEAVVGEWVKDIRHKMEAPQSDHAPSRDVTIDVLASNVDEMSITHSHVDPLFDYKHYFPQETNHVIDNRVDVRSNTGSSETFQDSFSYYGNKSIIAPEYGQMEMVSGYGNEVTGCGYGNEITGCGNGNGQECGCGYVYSDCSSFYRYHD